jgi:hypothetical protein
MSVLAQLEVINVNQTSSELWKDYTSDTMKPMRDRFDGVKPENREWAQEKLGLIYEHEFPNVP